MTHHNQRVGAWGEETAANWLAGQGYEISARNIRTPYGEIDIIARKDGRVLFVEVKTLTTSKSFFPEHQITARKRGHMLNAAAHYAAEHEIDLWQVDVLAIEGKPGSTPVIHYFENIQ